MSEFKGTITKIILDEFGPEFKGAYLRFYEYTPEDLDASPAATAEELNDSQKLRGVVKEGLALLSKKFLDGKLPDKENNLYEAGIADLPKLSFRILLKIQNTLQGGGDLKPGSA